MSMRKKLMVVDDSPTVRQQVSTVLAQAGYDVLEAVDGQDGLDKFTAATDVSLIVLDVNMPRMSGIELLERIKASGRTVPVLMLTTEGHTALVQRARAAGAKGWIIKPFKADLFIEAVKKLAA